jgi:demethylmenaquinone methyltransferase/2-methoxy-6-polyprenyl-1,4-benzoquinol methylase
VTAATRDAAGLPEGAAKRRSVDAMFDRIAPRYDRMNRLISCGQDVRWRRRVVAALELPPGARVLDVGCGTGDLGRELASAGHRPIGLDRSAGMLAAADRDHPLVRADGEALPVADASLDGIVSAFALRNVVDLEAVLRACARALRPGGRLSVLDAAVPEHAALRIGNAIWFRGAVPLLGRLVARDADAYSYLPRSMAYLPGPEVLAAQLGAAGFEGLARHTMTGGSVQLLVGTRA